MIGRLQGVLAEIGDDNCCLLDVHGVGYELFVPHRSWGQIHEGSEHTFYVYTHVREDALTLYGFLDRYDRSAFRSLLTVPSVGPKLALAIVGRLEGPQIATAIARGDGAAFRGISGVGKRTAERILIDLKDKFPVMPRAEVELGSASSGFIPGGRHAFDAVLQALVNMGYRSVEAQQAVAALDERRQDEPVAVLLRDALRNLAKV